MTALELPPPDVIRSMPAGRLMDALIAKHVLCLQVVRGAVLDCPVDGRPIPCYFCEHPEAGIVCSGDACNHREDWCWRFTHPDGRHSWLEVVPPSSTDISAAWEVVEALGLYDRMVFDEESGHILYKQNDGWIMQEVRWSDERCCYVWEIVTPAPTPALAICRQALVLVQQSQKKEPS